MKVSVSVPPSETRRPAALLWPGVVVASLFAGVHLFLLPSTLEDIDSLNFALGLREFDIWKHQPHPPGYPVYIALGRASLRVVEWFAGSDAPLAAASIALAIWSVIGGATAILAALHVAWRLGQMAGVETERRTVRVAFWSALLLAACPLFWMTGLRPLSDMPGLALALTSQALVLAAVTERRPGAHATRWLIWGSALAGLAIGVRTQTMWLTGPMLAYALVATNGGWRRTAPAGLAWAVGVALWAVPLVVVSGGVSAYVAAVGVQGSEDFTGVEMLFSHPTLRQLALTLYRTFIVPWAHLGLAEVVLASAVLGGAILLARRRRLAGVLAISAVPYLLFHLVFQETMTARYALPVVVPVVFLAAWGLVSFGRIGEAVLAGVVVASVVLGVPPSVTYGREAHPVFRALEDMHRAPERPAFVLAHDVLAPSLRAARAEGLPVLDSPRLIPWKPMMDHWLRGETAPVWFLADPRRTSLDAIEPGARRLVRTYRWGAAGAMALRGTRPVAADWYQVDPPRWFVGQGFSLTPETGGVTAANNLGPEQGPVHAYVRRGSHATATRVMFGGRYLPEEDRGPVTVELRMEGALVDHVEVTFAERNFLRFADLPQGVPTGADAYATLSLVARTVSERPIPIAIRQFDVRGSDETQWGYGAGWHEAEYDFEAGRRWRWSSGRSVLELRGAVRPLTLTFTVDAPSGNFHENPKVFVGAGRQRLEAFGSKDATEWRVEVPADAVADAGGQLVLETSPVFVPSERAQSADTRSLGLQILELHLKPAGPSTESERGGR